MYYYKNGDSLISSNTIMNLPIATNEEVNEFYNQFEQECLKNADYDELVNSEIRKKYTASQEFAILRQKDIKPQEYQEYYNYCEECKRLIKEVQNGKNQILQ